MTLLRESSFSSSGLWQCAGAHPAPDWPVGDGRPRCGRHRDSNPGPPAPKTDVLTTRPDRPLAVYFALLSFHSSIVGKTVEVLSDNVTTVAHINKFGSSNVSLDVIAQSIWAFALSNNVSLIAHHIAGVSNTGPDTLSRLSARHEWVLHPSIFRQLDRMFGPHTVDRFAAVGTALLPTYNSRFADPYSSGVDALGQTDWGAENNWVNPPFRLIPRVLDVIEAQWADATLIAPMWPGQPWMARLRRLCTAPPLRLPPVMRSCLPLSEQQRIEPHRNRGWTLFAWRTSGARGWRHEDGRRLLPAVYG